MLDEIINYVQSLQRQVEACSKSLFNETCNVTNKILEIGGYRFINFI